MTVDGIAEVVAFIVGGLVLAWGFRSLAFASSGDERSGRHEVGRSLVSPSADVDDELESEATEAASAARRHRFHQAANYTLSLSAMGALAAMLVGAYLA
jgi:hypothetical protein